MNYDDKVKLTKMEFPDFEIIQKQNSKFMKLLDVGLKILTLGKSSNFMNQYVTTVSDKVYVPTTWDSWKESTKYQILSHEVIHMRQSRRYTKYIFWIMYLFLPVPLLFSWFRTKFEMEAYEESMRIIKDQYGLQALRNKEHKEMMIKIFTGPDYGWMMINRTYVEKWYDGVIQKFETTVL